MFWENEASEKEFYKRILRTRPFQKICGDDFDQTPAEVFAKSMTLSLVRQILHHNFEDKLREQCLQEIGKTCCHMFIEFGKINTETDIDTFIKNINKACQGYRRFKRRNSLVYEEMYVGRCWCPIVNGITSDDGLPVMCECSKSARRELFQTILNKPVEVELLTSIACNDSKACHWVINLDPQKVMQSA